MIIARAIGLLRGAQRKVKFIDASSTTIVVGVAMYPLQVLVKDLLHVGEGVNFFRIILIMLVLST